MVTYHVGPRKPEVSTWWQAAAGRTTDPRPESASKDDDGVFISANGYGTD